MRRQWQMHAGRLTDLPDGEGFMDFGDPWYVRAHEHVPVPVEVTEDPDGTYWGWIDAEDQPDADGVPVMIQPHRGMFTMQFPYGPEIEQEHGKGEIVRLSVRELTN